MEWIYWASAIVIILISIIVSTAVMTALRTENPVGFQVVSTTDPSGQRFPIGVLYPTRTRPRPTTFVGAMLISVARNASVTGSGLPLVVISHGNGGGVQSHIDLALAFANAGFVVAIPQHTGDNYGDQSAFGTGSWLNRRSDEYRATVDYMLNDWAGHDHINSDRVGAFGFSAGGFTALTAIGAQPDLRLIAKHCAETPEFVCDLLRKVNSPLLNNGSPAMDTAFSSDLRIKAAVIVAPGLAFIMSPNGLGNVKVPIQLWHGDKDTHVPYATNIQPILDQLGTGVEFHSVAGAGHFSFLAPCGLLAPPALCAEQGNFDRKRFHADMNASVIAFFEKM